MRAALGLAPFLVACATAVPVVGPPNFPMIAADVEAKGGMRSVAELLDVGERAGVVCLGEQHDAAAHHRVHARLLTAWGDAWRTRGAEAAVGLEMFEVAMQPALDGFSRGEWTFDGLLEVSDWRHRWGHAPEPYRPIFDGARGARMTMLALNAARDVTRRVARGGLGALPSEVRASLPELVLDDVEHRRFFAAAMGEVHQGSISEGFYTAQVIWDETMAERAASWIATRSERPRRLVIVAGNGHCHDSAIPRRIERRLHARGIRDVEVVSVLTRLRGGTLPSFATSDYILTVDEEQMAKHKKSDDPPVEQYGDGIIARNRRAAFDYELGDTYEAGLQLIGSEVKVLRAGKADLSEAYVTIERDEAFLHGANIPEMSGTPFGHAPKRKRKLLLNRAEIEALERATEREGMTVVATKIYFRGGRAKLEIAVARGKKQFDKRETLKRKEADREARSAIGGGRRG